MLPPYSQPSNSTSVGELVSLQHAGHMTNISDSVTPWGFDPLQMSPAHLLNYTISTSRKLGESHEIKEASRFESLFDFNLTGWRKGFLIYMCA